MTVRYAIAVYWQRSRLAPSPDAIGVLAEKPPVTEARLLRVLHVITALGQGGAERLLAELIARNAGQFQHSVLTLTDSPCFFDLHDTPVVSLELRRGRVSPLALVKAAAICRETAPDLIHAWLYHANLLAGLMPRRRGIPLLWSIHNTTLPPDGAKTLTRRVNWLCARLSHWVPWRIVYCAESARVLHESIYGYDRAHGVVVENGVDLDAFEFDRERRQTNRAAWGLEPDAIALGCIGRFDPQKDHATVLAALRRLDDSRVRLIVAGDGCGLDNPAFAALLRDSEVGARVISLGLVKDMRGLLSALDMLVIGSAFGEALPMVALEAAASGLPIVATAVGSAAELVLDPAHLAPPRNANALADAMRAALPLATLRDQPLPVFTARRDRLRNSRDIATTVAAYHGLYRAGLAAGG